MQRRAELTLIFERQTLQTKLHNRGLASRDYCDTDTTAQEGSSWCTRRRVRNCVGHSGEGSALLWFSQTRRMPGGSADDAGGEQEISSLSAAVQRAVDAAAGGGGLVQRVAARLFSNELQGAPSGASARRRRRALAPYAASLTWHRRARSRRRRAGTIAKFLDK